jgi:hypothetical protein
MLASPPTLAPPQPLSMTPLRETGLHRYLDPLGDIAAVEATPASAAGHWLDAQHLRRRPAGRQPTAMQLIDGQGLQPAHQPGTKITQVAEQELSAWRHGGPGIRKRQATRSACRTTGSPGGQGPHASKPPRPTAPWDKSLENARSAPPPSAAAVRGIGADHPHLRPSRPAARTQAGPRRTAALRALPSGPPATLRNDRRLHRLPVRSFPGRPGSRVTTCMGGGEPGSPSAGSSEPLCRRHDRTFIRRAALHRPACRTTPGRRSDNARYRAT